MLHQKPGDCNPENQHIKACHPILPSIKTINKTSVFGTQVYKGQNQYKKLLLCFLNAYVSGK